MKNILKKVEENRVVYILVYAVSTAIMGMIIWPLLDIFVCKFFTHSKFVYSVSGHIIEPVIFGLIVGFIFSFINNKSKKNK